LAKFHLSSRIHWRDLSLPFYGYNKPDAKPSEGVRDAFLDQGMQSSIIASYGCIKAFSGTDLTEDLKKIGVPTPVLHGDTDQIVPLDLEDSAYLGGA
jgi:non-heme chloroperoxidase